jgi:hypothetical protein
VITALFIGFSFVTGVTGRAFANKVVKAGKAPVETRKVLLFCDKGFAFLVRHVHPLFPQRITVMKKPLIPAIPAAQHKKSAAESTKSTEQNPREQQQSRRLPVIQRGQSEYTGKQRVPQKYAPDAENGERRKHYDYARSPDFESFVHFFNPTIVRHYDRIFGSNMKRSFMQSPCISRQMRRRNIL